MKQKKSCSILINGRVQQVGFRYHARQAAIKYGVKGFVRNQSDGTVYVEVEGDSFAVDMFCQWCQKGPSWARVDRSLICEIPLQNFEDFNIK